MPMANSVIIKYLIHPEQPQCPVPTGYPIKNQELYEPLLSACLKALRLPTPSLLHIAKNRYGKPYLPDFPEIDFNIAHSKNITVCCMGQGVRTGIDIEYLEASLGFDIKAVQHILPEQYISEICNSASPRTAFIEYWTKLESIIKADGKGYTNSLHDITLQNSSAALLGNEKWHLHKIPIHHHFVVHLATDKKVATPIAQALSLEACC
jgi:phosphopantetheinyl transferase